jgi:hypothetical protein
VARDLGDRGPEQLEAETAAPDVHVRDLRDRHGKICWPRMARSFLTDA